MFVVAVGSLFSGITLIGSFHSYEAAREWANANSLHEWHVEMIHLPDSKEAGWYCRCSEEGDHAGREAQT